MANIVFFDLEVTTDGEKIADIGAIKESGEKLHTTRMDLFTEFVKGADFLCGHNIINHDMKFVRRIDTSLGEIPVIDTLMLSCLLFPEKPYHRLVKDDKLLVEQANNPLNDSIQAKDLFFDEYTAYQRLNDDMKLIYKGLLKNTEEFGGFFRYVDNSKKEPFKLFGGFSRQDNSNNFSEIESVIKRVFHGKICENVNLNAIIRNNPIELAYALAIISTDDGDSITPRWVLHT